MKTLAVVVVLAAIVFGYSVYQEYNDYYFYQNDDDIGAVKIVLYDEPLIDVTEATVYYAAFVYPVRIIVKRDTPVKFVGCYFALPPAYDDGSLIPLDSEMFKDCHIEQITYQEAWDKYISRRFGLNCEVK